MLISLHLSPLRTRSNLVFSALLLHDAQLESRRGGRSQMPYPAQFELCQPEWSTVTIGQGYESLPDPDRKNDTFVRKILVPAFGKLQMSRHLWKMTEIEAASFS